ncbi:NAD(P)/FAD-dependent oxidoreductase [Sediminispirochaeta smaragdinae]|jgi:NADPH-dependent 2,4-dienoyl-CoA reductase/sulfur reductase-like enzyme|uniref:FAD-dependent pyridine nucleotide-disulfide oxidoreductase n=1 Tax=Sediminispirochaeta smaragdinae (strain DSM 11293 / JCM 15392 / SEBR 4228) TaxID=573413 RepID=E1R7C7_SEDSS|nr:FAD-dependent oxidoreductase [Sediminispirochaeta smaragdinae]ADK82632.1 FAD-dependent pyridine nucleotide-disulfide oxidoreductase [Sediminispirochaeta smaragdinae DSM 11293]
METTKQYDVIVIGGGPAGMAAAIKAYEEGKGKVLIIERNDSLGGILPQCIHNGFGAVNFDRDYPGPQYAYMYEKKLRSYDIEILLDTMVLEISAEKEVYAMNSAMGYLHLQSKAIVLAMGCRERTRSQIRLPGTRAAGIYTAGTAQRLVNIEGYMPGKRIVILGSGDIGMIMARRFTIEGAKVLSVLELQPFLTGLRRNYVQCLQDYGIPLHLSTTVNKIMGADRVEAIETIQVDEQYNPIEGSEEILECDTLVLSVGLIPENEISRKAGVKLDRRTNGPIVDSYMMTSIPGIFAAGNVTFVYDLVDYVSQAGELAGLNAARYARNERIDSQLGIRLKPGRNVGSVVPQKIMITKNDETGTSITLRPNALIEHRVTVELKYGDETVVSFKEQYARPAEMMFHKLKEKELARLEEIKSGELTAVIS